MSLSIDDVNHIAQLARLQIEASDASDYAANLSAILDFVAQLDEADTRNVTPMAHPIASVQPTRADEATPITPDEKQASLSLAPETEADLYLVPQVIE